MKDFGRLTCVCIRLNWRFQNFLPEPSLASSCTSSSQAVSRGVLRLSRTYLKYQAAWMRVDPFTSTALQTH